jgi:hypothetical protein
MPEPIFQADLEVATEPHDSIMPSREVAAEAARAHSRPASALLREIVNNGSWVLARCASSGCVEVDVDLAAFGFYRTVVEMADGVDVSIRESSVTPAVPQLRALFEASLQLQYVLEDRATYRERALAWFAWHYIGRLRRYERYDPSTTAGKQFVAEKADDETGPRLREMNQAQVAAGIARMHTLLAKPHVLPFKQRYDALVAAKKYPRFWCQLCGGPANRRELARHLRLGAVYSELYSHWSATSHAEDLYTFFMHVPGQGGVIRPLRGSVGLLRVTGMAATFALRSTKQMLAHFREGEDSYDRWHKQNVRSLYRAVMGLDVTKQP